MDFGFAGGPLFSTWRKSLRTFLERRGLAVQRAVTHAKGQGLVEFALVVPLFLLLLFGMVEFGRAWMTKNIITGAAREAVRIYAVIPYSESAAMDRAVNILTSAGLDDKRWNISMSAGGVDNNIMKADVSYNFRVVIVGFIPGLATDNVLLTTSTTMRRE